MRVIFRKDVIKTALTRRREASFIFTDENIAKLYGGELKKYLNGVPVYIMRAGEAYKNEQTLFALLSAMAEAGLTRGSTLIALGGGVVGDIGGLAASLYMRGIDCIQVPTTLLSQVDASVGGKTAIDFRGIKNLIGAFYQPVATYIDPAFLKTLPPREIRSGLGEIIKHGALYSPIFEKLLESREKLFDLEFLSALVPENIAFKSSIAKQDARDRGVRKCLNLGHTTAHALELSGTGLAHGECVLAGLILESRIAQRRLDCDREFLENLRALCIKALDGQKITMNPEQAARAATMDKKNEAEKIVLTVPTAPEKYALLALTREEYIEALKSAEEGLC